MLVSNDNRVVSFYNDVNGRKRDSDNRLIGSTKSHNGYLYVIGGNGSYAVQVCLPLSLIEYANARSGTMSGLRPVGIRTGEVFKTAEDAADAVARIFNTPDTLTKFINDSEADANYVPGTINSSTAKVQIITVNPLDRPMSEFNIEALYGKGTIMLLRNKFPKTVMGDYKALTRREFEGRYNLAEVVAV